MIEYPYPVSKQAFKYSRRDKTLFVQVKRLPHKYEDDGQLFYVNPNDHYTLLPITPDFELLESLLNAQFSPSEWEIVCSDILLEDHPLLKAKRVISLIMSHTSDFFLDFKYQMRVVDPIPNGMLELLKLSTG